MRDAVFHIIRESRRHAHRERTGFLPSSAPGGRGWRVDIVISDAAVGHTLVDIVVADPTRRDLVERAARHDLVAATHAERRKETVRTTLVCAPNTRLIGRYLSRTRVRFRSASLFRYFVSRLCFVITFRET